MSRIVKRVCLFLLLGAIINIAVAWSCSAWSRLTPLEPDAYNLWIDRAAQRIRHMYSERGFGYEERLFDVTHNQRHVSLNFAKRGRTAKPWLAADLMQSGWPCYALGSNMIKEGDDLVAAWRRGWLIPQPLPGQPQPSHRRLSFNPVWPGFAINTLFYAAILFLTFVAPFALRRRRRIKRGLCPACAYPRGSSDRCTECGHCFTIEQT